MTFKLDHRRGLSNNDAVQSIVIWILRWLNEFFHSHLNYWGSQSKKQHSLGHGIHNHSLGIIEDLLKRERPKLETEASGSRNVGLFRYSAVSRHDVAMWKGRPRSNFESLLSRLVQTCKLYQSLYKTQTFMIMYKILIKYQYYWGATLGTAMRLVVYQDNQLGTFNWFLTRHSLLPHKVKAFCIWQRRGTDG